MDFTLYIDIPILIIVYLMVEFIKAFILKDKEDKRRNLIPLISLLIGAALSLLIYFVWPNMSNSVNALNAFASGAISGSAATGSNQIYKKAMGFFNPGN